MDRKVNKIIQLSNCRVVELSLNTQFLNLIFSTENELLSCYPKHFIQ